MFYQHHSTFKFYRVTFTIKITCVITYQMLVLAEEADSRRDVLRQRRLNDKHYVYDRVFGEGSTQVGDVPYFLS